MGFLQINYLFMLICGEKAILACSAWPKIVIDPNGKTAYLTDIFLFLFDWKMSIRQTPGNGRGFRTLSLNNM